MLDGSEGTRKYTSAGMSAATALAKVMSDRLDGDLTIEVGERPSYNPTTDTLRLPALPGDDVGEHTLALLRAYLGHEAAERGINRHYHRPEADKLTRGAHGLLNAMNDARIDKIQGERYPGYRLNVERALRHDLDGARKANEVDPIEVSVNSVGVMVRHVLYGTTDVDGVKRDFPQFADVMDEIRDDLDAVDLSDEDDVWRAALDLYRKLTGRDPFEEPEGQGQGQGADEGEGDSGEESGEESGDGQGGRGQGDEGEGNEGDGAGSGSDDSEGEGEGDSEGGDDSGDGSEDDGAGSGDGDGDGGDEGKEGDAKGADAGGGEGDGTADASGGDSDDGTTDTDGGADSGEGSAGGAGGGGGIPDAADTDWDPQQRMLDEAAENIQGESRGDGALTKHQSYTYDDRADYVGPWPDYWNEPGREIRDADFARPTQVLATRLRQALTAPEPRDRRRQLKGAVDGRAIAQLAIGRDDVLKRRTKAPGRSVAVSVSVDLSASMNKPTSSPRMATARGTLAVLGAALDRVGVPFEILGWSTDGDLGLTEAQENGRVYRMFPVRHVEVSVFGQPWDDDTRRTVANLRGYGDTPTGEGIQLAAERLARRREARKVLLLITDGKPGTSSWGGRQPQIDYLETTVERARSAGIEVVGIGIGAGVDLSDHCDHWLTVDAADDLQAEASRKLVDLLDQTERDATKGRERR